MVAIRIGLGSELSDDGAIHNYATFANELFGFPAAGNAGMRQQLL
jgi:hypothetical protein